MPSSSRLVGREEGDTLAALNRESVGEMADRRKTEKLIGSDGIGFGA